MDRLTESLLIRVCKVPTKKKHVSFYTKRHWAVVSKRSLSTPTPEPLCKSLLRSDSVIEPLHCCMQCQGSKEFERKLASRVLMMFGTSSSEVLKCALQTSSNKNSYCFLSWKRTHLCLALLSWVKVDRGVAVGRPERQVRKASHWQQATTDITRYKHSIIACSRHIHGCYSSRTSRSWWIAHWTQRQPKGCNRGEVLSLLYCYGQMFATCFSGLSRFTTTNLSDLPVITAASYRLVLWNKRFEVCNSSFVIASTVDCRSTVSERGSRSLFFRTASLLNMNDRTFRFSHAFMWVGSWEFRCRF